jgi:Na+/H+ antiporter NhaD/arsenite permease-like protein
MAIEDAYTNPNIVLLALILLIFIVIFTVLTRFGFGKNNRGIVAIIAAVISLFLAYRYKEMAFEFFVLNTTLTLVVVAVAVVFFIILLRFTRRQF